MAEALTVLLALVAGWLATGVAGLAVPRAIAARGAVVAKVLFPVGALLGAALAGVALFSIADEPQAVVLPVGLPGLPFHFRLDALSAFFLALIGATSAGVSVFAAGYFSKSHGEEEANPGLLCLQYHVFLAAMALVVLADDAYAFMVMWETMALASFFLVVTNHRDAATRKAGYLYLLIAHLGAIAILLCFGVLGETADYAFADMRTHTLEPFWASVAFLLALAGFGAKAGLLPLHVWLPEAHPAAPSPVSALMSAVMLKTALYGFLRVTYDLVGTQLWWWGVAALGVGLATAIFGVVFAAVQTDMKRLLAWSSIENVGLMFAAAGLSVLFHAYGMAALAALALTAALYLAAAHALFKSLLFVGTGAVLHATRERSLGRLGGLIRAMPWVAWLSLAGVLAAAGLPPFGGFVAEWLLLQAFLFTPGLPNSFLNMLVPVAAALVALVAALAGYTMVKFFGVVFLGRPREEKLGRAQDAGRWERGGMLLLAAGCVALGLAPVQVVGLIDPVTRGLVGTGLASTVAEHGWLLVPVALERASYGPALFLAGIVAGVALAFVLVRGFYHGRVRRSAAWDCGYPWQGARMQDTAEGFGQPIRQIFEPFFRMERELPSPDDARPRYRVRVGDHFWHLLYLPIAAVVERAARVVGLLQQGRIAVYLLYSFVTVVGVLLWVS